MIDLVAGARPNFMKVAPIWHALTARGVPVRVLHTGQHRDAAMSEVFFRDLGLPAPDVVLATKGVGDTPGAQTAAILVGVEADLLAHRPAIVVVVGDVTGTLAAALAAAKLGVPVAHVEAGLRARDWAMPEEINRVLTDQLADLLLTPSADAAANLRAEGIPDARVAFVGNVMVDALHHALARPTDVLTRLGLAPGAYAVATLHRPANVDHPAALAAALGALGVVAARLPTVFPVHPRTRARLAALGLADGLARVPGLRLAPPLGYRDCVTLVRHARLVATDSGGLQEETTALGVPCFTLRETTERPVTVTEGTNTLVGTDPGALAAGVDAVLAGRAKRGRVPDGWDGGAAARIVDALERFARGAPPPRARRGP